MSQVTNDGTDAVTLLSYLGAQNISDTQLLPGSVATSRVAVCIFSGIEFNGSLFGSKTFTVASALAPANTFLGAYFPEIIQSLTNGSFNGCPEKVIKSNDGSTSLVVSISASPVFNMFIRPEVPAPSSEKSPSSGTSAKKRKKTVVIIIVVVVVAVAFAFLALLIFKKNKI